jgi:hypothetical protein
LYNKSLHQSCIIFIILRGHISNAAWGTYNFVVGPIEGKKLSNTATVFILNAGMLVTQQHVIQQVDSFDQSHLSTNQHPWNENYCKAMYLHLHHPDPHLFSRQREHIDDRIVP